MKVGVVAFMPGRCLGSAVIREDHGRGIAHAQAAPNLELILSCVLTVSARLVKGKSAKRQDRRRATRARRTGGAPAPARRRVTVSRWLLECRQEKKRMAEGGFPI